MLKSRGMALRRTACARALQEQVVSIRRHVLGEDDPDTLTSMNNR